MEEERKEGITNIQARPLRQWLHDEKLTCGSTSSPLSAGEEDLPDKLIVARGEARWADQAGEFISLWILKILSGGHVAARTISEGWVILDGTLYLCHLRTSFANVIKLWQPEICTVFLSSRLLLTPAQPERTEQPSDSCSHLCPQQTTLIYLAGSSKRGKQHSQTPWDGGPTPCV